MNNSIIKSFKLRSGYKDLDKRSMKNAINDHIECLFSLSNIAESNSKVNLQKFSITAYNEMSDKICYERISTYENYETYYDKYDETKLTLYNKVIESLGSNYHSDNLLMNRTIDLTIENIIKFAVFNDLAKSVSPLGIDVNPWEISSKILDNLHVLYYFSDDLTYYESDLRKSSNNKESEISRDLKINVFAKGNNKNFSNDSIRDTFALKNLLVNELKSQKNNSSKPIKADNIIKFFRDLSISDVELTDSNIKNWIIKPLKANVLIGSNRKGYFVITDENDLNESYKSHLNKYKGYINTLNRHKNLANHNNWDTSNFDKHNTEI